MKKLDQRHSYLSQATMVKSVNNDIHHVIYHDDIHDDRHDNVHDDVHDEIHDDVHYDVPDDIHDDIHNDIHDDIHDYVHDDIDVNIHDDIDVNIHDLAYFEMVFQFGDRLTDGHTLVVVKLLVQLKRTRADIILQMHHN